VVSDAALPRHEHQVAGNPSESIPSRRVWEFSYLITFPITVAVIMLAAGDLAERLTSAALVALIGVAYALVRRRLDAHSSGYRRDYAVAYQVVAVVAFAAAVRLEFWAGMVLTALCPIAYLTLGMVLGHVAVVMLAMLPTAAELHRSQDLLGTVTGTLPWSLATIAFSVFVSLAIARAELRSAHRADLVTELEATREEVARLAREAGAEAERRRLAGDIHDTVAAGLSSIAMLVEAADRTLATEPDVARRHLSTAASAVRENLQEARALVGALGPAPLSGSTLVDALRRLCLGAGSTVTTPGNPDARHSVHFELNGSVRALPTEVEVALLRIAQESLANVRKHANAAHAWITLDLRADSVTLEIRDDGQGFDVTAPAAGYGVEGMRDRIARVGGELSIQSGPGRGTHVRAEVPA
jgi:signal transduction histidine kinase